MPGSTKIPNESLDMNGIPSLGSRDGFERNSNAHASGHASQNGFLHSDSSDTSGERVLANGYRNDHVEPMDEVLERTNILEDKASLEDSDEAPEEITMVSAASSEAARAQRERRTIRKIKLFKRRRRKSKASAKLEDQKRQSKESLSELVQNISDDVLQRAEDAEEAQKQFLIKKEERKKLLESVKRQKKVIEKKRKRRRVDAFDVALHDAEREVLKESRLSGAEEAEKWLLRQLSRRRKASVLSERRTNHKVSPLAFFSKE